MRSMSQLHFPSAAAKILLIGSLGAVVMMTPASALNVATPSAFGIKAASQASGDLIEVRAVARRGGMARGPRGGMVGHRGGAAVGYRGGAYRSRTAVVGPRGNVAVRSRTAVVGRGGWARPGWYGWPRGGAIAAGAAIGFVSAATAAAWAGAAPAPGMCWYYTDPSRTQGFWDYCR
ncbi:hypothetical protein [Bradyrhizobium sp.]|uniref:hypothetical protein n=1 Tax=Bradyrhizobium sp. TaxID=376 RepID=UPI002637BCD8|nr:hypothetical protein [Bradyrhizobium sp.]